MGCNKVLYIQAYIFGNILSKYYYCCFFFYIQFSSDRFLLIRSQYFCLHPYHACSLSPPVEILFQGILLYENFPKTLVWNKPSPIFKHIIEHLYLYCRILYSFQLSYCGHAYKLYCALWTTVYSALNSSYESICQFTMHSKYFLIVALKSELMVLRS